jgi:hypothetical protein
MKKFFLLNILMIMSSGLLAQNNAPITEIDYSGATRYTGARNIARTTDGYVMVVFEPSSAYTNQETWYAFYNSAFLNWDIAQLSNSPTNDTGNPAVFADEQGKIYATWKENSGDARRNAMFSKCTFTDPFTYSWSTPVVVDTIDNNAGVLTIDSDIYDNPFIMFSIWNDPAVYNANIYVSKSSDGGTTWVTDNLTSVFPTPNVVPFNWIDVNLTHGANGKMYAVWEDKPSETTSQYEIMLSEYAPGIGWSLPEIISPIFDGGPQLQKYVDALTPITSAVSVFQMGPAGYTFEGKSSVIYNDNGTSKVFTATFNPYYTVPKSNNEQWLGDFLSYLGLSTSSSILFVDDDNKYNNETVITSVLDSLGYSNVSPFDCGNNSGMALNIPQAADYAGKDAVIWFTGDDSNNLAFWNIADQDNTELINYLNTQGKKLIVIGIDFLYDRYGTAPDSFAVGDFVYDKLGIQSYDGQSWANDGNTGVSELNLASGNTMTTLTKLSWGQGGTRQGEPSIATDPSNNLHMVYLDDNGKHILYKKYDGVSWSDSIRIDESADTTLTTRPNISIDPNYGVYVTWQEVTEKVNGVNIYNVKYRTSSNGGTTWGSVGQLSNTSYANTGGYSTSNPTIGKKVRKAITAVNFEGGAEVIWTEANASSSLGYYIMYSRIPYVGSIVSVEDDKVSQPLDFSMDQNYPNPFNPSTTIEFKVDIDSHVSLEIYNIVGQKVDQIVNEKLVTGNYKYTWNAKEFPSGVYFAKLQSDGRQLTKKLTLLK